MKNLKQLLKNIDNQLNKVQPKTMDDLIDAVHSVDGLGSFGTSFSIVKYKGYLQGVRVHITGRKLTHTLPFKNKVYSVFNGIEKYEKAGFNIIND